MYISGTFFIRSRYRIGICFEVAKFHLFLGVCLLFLVYVLRKIRVLLGLRSELIVLL